MAKSNKNLIFYCKECGNEFSKWSGQCPACSQWNTIIEAPASFTAKAKGGALPLIKFSESAAVFVSDISTEIEDRMTTGIGELDRVLGGGIVQGSLILVGGDPGIGKSTLLLQACRLIALSGQKVLYISGEESKAQIKLRADRIGEFSNHCLILSETDLSIIAMSIEKLKPSVVIIDSIQTMYSEDISSTPGSVSQVRESTNLLLRMAKSLSVSIFIVGHVTKDGSVAGPKLLEHMVDAVLYFEGDSRAAYRILRGVKNRFGSTQEIGVFEMDKEGLKEVVNPSAFLLQDRPEDESGSVVVAAMEGSRPLLLEMQALVSRTNFGLPRRQSMGADLNRVNLLLAVLEKRLDLPLSGFDTYLNVVGGIKVTQPSADMGIVISILSSYYNISLPHDLVAFGEIGLSGEVRGVSFAAQRITEAAKIGFGICVLPKASMPGLKEDEIPKGIRLMPMGNVGDIKNMLLLRQ